MEDKAYVPRPLRVVPNEVVVAWWSFLLRVACEHALQTDTHAFHVVYRAPTLFVEKVETNDAVGVDVWVPGYWVRIIFDKDHFWGLGEVSVRNHRACKMLWNSGRGAYGGVLREGSAPRWDSSG